MPHRGAAALILTLWASACRPANAPCTTSADCLDSEVCVEKFCRQRCDAHGDCSAGEYCLGNACMPVGQACDSAGDCLDSEVCSEGVCRRLCEADRDCACQAGQVCTAATVCREGVCRQPCTEDATCPPGSICVADVCRRGEHPPVDAGLPDTGSPDAQPGALLRTSAVTAGGGFRSSEHHRLRLFVGAPIGGERGRTRHYKLHLGVAPQSCESLEPWSHR